MNGCEKDPASGLAGPAKGRGGAFATGRPPQGKEAGAEIRFPTESGKAQFLARPCMPPGELPDSDFPFVLITGRVATGGIP